MSEHDAPDAEEARPWRPSDGPGPAVRVFPYGQQPMMRVRAQRKWHTCTVLARYDYADGRTVYQVDIDLVIDGQRAGTTRSYLWNPKAMKPLRPGTR